ncbi:MAG: recombination protein NinB [Rhodanobacteraceae bacterium]
MKHSPFVIDHKNPNWRLVLVRCVQAVEDAANFGSITVRIVEAIRSLDQNAKMWPMLEDFAAQVPMVINGRDTLTDSDDWKALLTACFEGESRMALGLRGGFVMLGARTSGYTKKKMADFITFLYAEGNERGVKWSDRSVEHFERFASPQKSA